MSACTRHHGLCAYPAEAPGRCPRCHRAWRTIVERDGETLEHHTAQHLTAVDARAKADRRRAARREETG